MFGFDPSKMDPKALMELSQLLQQLPPERINKMQSLMHNMMAGFDVRREMEEFEQTLPPDFRQKLVEIMARQAAATPPEQSTISGLSEAAEPSGTIVEPSLHEARMTILRGVADGKVSPEEAEKLLFS